MKWWHWVLLGAGVGALVFTERGRKLLRWGYEKAPEAQLPSLPFIGPKIPARVVAQSGLNVFKDDFLSSIKEEDIKRNLPGYWKLGKTMQDKITTGMGWSLRTTGGRAPREDEAGWVCSNIDCSSVDFVSPDGQRVRMGLNAIGAYYATGKKPKYEVVR